MPMDIRSLQRHGVEIKIPFYGDDLVITYDPLKFTPRFRDEYAELSQQFREPIQERIRQLQDRARREREGEDVSEESLEDIATLTWREQHRPAAALITHLIKGWDIEVDGEPLPLDVERMLDELPYPLFGAIIEAVWEDVGALGNPKSSNGTKPG